MYLDMWDNVIRDMVYIIGTSDCEMIYHLLGGYACGLGRYPHFVLG